MNFKMLATINGVLFDNAENYKRVSHLLSLIKAPEFVRPTKSFIKFLQGCVTNDKDYKVLCVALDDEYNRVLSNMNEMLDLDDFDGIDDFTVELMIGEPFELKLNPEQMIVLETLRPVLYAAIELGLINQDAQDDLIGIL